MKRPAATMLVTTALAITGVAPAAAMADDWQVMSRSTAAVRPSLVFTTDPKAARIEFKAFDFSGFLLGDGSWQVSSPVTHQGLVCGTYEVGVRFGAGNPGCTDVRWFSEPMYIGSRRQCNESTVDHVGGETTPALGSRLPSITCVERVLRCVGNCK